MGSQQTKIEDHFGTALAFLMLGVAGGLALDICAKWLLVDYSLEQFVFLRSGFGVIFFLMSARWYGGLGSLKSKRWLWHLLRTALATGAMFGFFYGLSRMPLVNALTIAFLAPLIVTALSVPFLGEHVGWRRWLAVFAGFIGVLIVLRPGSGMFTPASIAVLIAAFCWAGLSVTARKLACHRIQLSHCRCTLRRAAGCVGLHAARQLHATYSPMPGYSSPCWPVFGGGLGWHCRRLSSGSARSAGALRVHSIDWWSHRRLSHMGRSARPVGSRWWQHHHRERHIYRLPGNWQRHDQSIPESVYSQWRRRYFQAAVKAIRQEVTSHQGMLRARSASAAITPNADQPSVSTIALSISLAFSASPL